MCILRIKCTDKQNSCRRYNANQCMYVSVESICFISDHIINKEEATRCYAKAPNELLPNIFNTTLENQE